jgi:hypothetical protein
LWEPKVRVGLLFVFLPCLLASIGTQCGLTDYLRKQRRVVPHIVSRAARVVRQHRMATAYPTTLASSSQASTGAVTRSSVAALNLKTIM